MAALEGKVALVTGAAGSIGAAVCTALADDGARVVATDVDGARLAAVTEEMGERVATVVMDVSDPDAVAAGMNEARARAGEVDVLVNVAGILSNNKLMETSVEEWRRIHAVNLDSAFFLCKEVVPHMKAAGWGRIVNVSSFAWKSGGKTSGTAYSSSKAAMVGLTFTVAKEVAEFGVTVNAIAPAYVMSPMVTEQLDEAQRRAQLESIPVRRFAQPEEVAHAVRFLASPLAAFVTGEVVDMNGGFQFD